MQDGVVGVVGVVACFCGWPPLTLAAVRRFGFAVGSATPSPCARLGAWRAFGAWRTTDSGRDSDGRSRVAKLAHQHSRTI